MLSYVALGDYGLEYGKTSPFISHVCGRGGGVFHCGNGRPLADPTLSRKKSSGHGETISKFDPLLTLLILSHRIAHSML